MPISIKEAALLENILPVLKAKLTLLVLGTAKRIQMEDVLFITSA